MSELTLQYIKAIVTILLGVFALVLPTKYNLFRFKPYGTGKRIGDMLSEKVKKRIPQVIGVLCIFVGLVVLILTPILGPMPWE